MEYFSLCGNIPEEMTLFIMCVNREDIEFALIPKSLVLISSYPYESFDFSVLIMLIISWVEKDLKTI